MIYKHGKLPGDLNPVKSQEISPAVFNFVQAAANPSSHVHSSGENESIAGSDSDSSEEMIRKCTDFVQKENRSRGLRDFDSDSVPDSDSVSTEEFIKCSS